MTRRKTAILALLLSGLILAGCSRSPSPASTDKGPAAEIGKASGEPVTLTLYSGRDEELVGPLLKQFEEETGITLKVRYANTAELAATILEEGTKSPADVYLAQDAGALGAIAKEGLFARLPDPVLEKVEPRFRSKDGLWVGVTGRARVVAYNTERLSPGDLPDSILDFTDPKWKGRIGWPPTNGSFQAFITALRVTKGEETARNWLRGIIANEPKDYAKNTAAVEAVGRGEVDVAFVNHYYLFRLKEEHGPDFPVALHYPKDGDPGSLINVAGTGVLKSSRNKGAAEKLVEYLLSETAQKYFAGKTFEYPLAKGVKTGQELVPLAEIQTPGIDLSDLSDLERTLDLLRDTGAI